jgi:hypothetical protein
MLITAMPTQISEMRTTWAVFTDLVLVIREARNDPRSSTAFGAAPLVGQDCSITAVAPMPSPTDPRPMARFAHAARLSWRAGWMPRCASLASTCLSISELILSTSPSATAPSYAWPSSPYGVHSLIRKVYVAIFVARRSPITVSIASRSRSVIANIAKWPHVLSMTRSSLSGIRACSSS